MPDFMLLFAVIVTPTMGVFKSLFLQLKGGMGEAGTNFQGCVLHINAAQICNPLQYLEWKIVEMHRCASIS